jgi:hypothetical protein
MSLLMDHAESWDHLLRNADHHDALIAGEASEVLACDLFLSLASLKPNNRDVVPLGECIDAGDEFVGQSPEQLRRGHRPASVLGEEPPEIHSAG